MPSQEYEPIQRSDEFQTDNDNTSHAYDDINTIQELPHTTLTQPDSTSWSVIRMLRKYAKFVGPGLMVSVSYMDPGNYSTAVAAGSAHRYKLLFSVLVSNFMAAFWQYLCARLGAVTGLDLSLIHI